MLVFGGTYSMGLAWTVAKSLDAQVGKSEVKTFPDGETYVKIASNVAGKECTVIQSVKTNDHLVELLLMLDALRDLGATQVNAVMPYLGYMRQDKRFSEGESLSAKTVLKTIDEVSDSITTINCHFLNSPGEAVYNNIRFMNLDAMPLLADHICKKVDKPAVIAPDKGSVGYAKCVADHLDCEFDHLTKKRISGHEVAVECKDMEISGHDVLILDDIISTGGTIVESVKVIRRCGPASINVGCVHGLFIKGIDSFKGVVDRLVATDTVENPVSKVSVAELIADDLRR